MNQTLSLTKDPIPSLIKKIAIPASVGTFFQTMFNIVDTFFAGKISPEALSALAKSCLLYTSPSPRDKRQSRMPSSA